MNPVKLLFDNNKPQQIINTPFKLDCINEISMFAYKPLFGNGEEFKVRGAVKFKNGNTRGEQEFTADNLTELFIKIQRFCETLR